MLTPLGLQSEICLRNPMITAHQVRNTIVKEDHFALHHGDRFSHRRDIFWWHV
jgi:hypothetical protein